jgi:hypothetical protein
VARAHACSEETRREVFSCSVTKTSGMKQIVLGFWVVFLLKIFRYQIDLSAQNQVYDLDTACKPYYSPNSIKIDSSNHQFRLSEIMQVFYGRKCFHQTFASSISISLATVSDG